MSLNPCKACVAEGVFVSVAGKVKPKPIFNVWKCSQIGKPGGGCKGEGIRYITDSQRYTDDGSALNLCDRCVEAYSKSGAQPWRPYYVTAQKSKNQLCHRHFREEIDEKGGLSDKGAFFAAIKKGDDAKVKELLDKGFELPATLAGPSLMAAVQNGHVAIATLLLEKKADPNAEQEGIVPLEAAITKSYSPLVEILFKHGAALVKRKELDYLQLAIQSYKDESSAPMIASIVAAMKAASSSKDLLFDLPDLKGKTALMLCCEKGLSESVKILLQNRAQASTEDKEGNTPLHYAGLAQSLECVKLLLEQKAAIQATNKAGKTALLEAVRVFCTTEQEEKKSIELTELLINAKGIVNHQDQAGLTPLLHAIRQRARIVLGENVRTCSLPPSDWNATVIGSENPTVTIPEGWRLSTMEECIDIAKSKARFGTHVFLHQGCFEKDSDNAFPIIGIALRAEQYGEKWTTKWPVDASDGPNPGSILKQNNKS